VSVPTWLLERPIAHRGLLEPGVPENSRTSVTRALEAGFAVEVDVRPSRSGTPWLSHDDGLERTTGTAARLSVTDDERLRELTLTPTGEPLLSLGELVALLRASDGCALVELKPQRRGRVRVLDAVLAALAPLPRDQVVVESFDPVLVRDAARRGPWATGQLVGLGRDPKPLPAGRAPRNAARAARWSRPDALVANLERYGAEGARALADELGLPLVLWTVRTPAQLAAAREVGAGIVFEPGCGLTDVTDVAGSAG
jgi:glycerophosphoryl diester phosphodiesterase